MENKQNKAQEGGRLRGTEGHGAQKQAQCWAVAGVVKPRQPRQLN